MHLCYRAYYANFIGLQIRGTFMHKEDNHIVEKIRFRDEDAFKYIFTSYYKPLCYYAKEFVKDGDIAEEIVSGIIYKLWENADRIIISTSLRAYLFKSVNNSCLNYIKHQKVEGKYKDYLRHHLTEFNLTQPLSTNYPVANLVCQELEDKINSTLESLPKQCREVFLLSRFEEMQYDQIAEKLKISNNTVKTQIKRALEKFRKNLKEYLPLLLFFIKL